MRLNKLSSDLSLLIHTAHADSRFLKPFPFFDEQHQIRLHSHQQSCGARAINVGIYHTAMIVNSATTTAKVILMTTLRAILASPNNALLFCQANVVRRRLLVESASGMGQV